MVPPALVYFPAVFFNFGLTGFPRVTTFYQWVRQPLCKRIAKVFCQPGSIFDGNDLCLSSPMGMRQWYNDVSKRGKCSVCTGLSVSPGGLSKIFNFCKNGTFPSLDGSACVRNF